VQSQLRWSRAAS
jgi:hypothetical protein